MISAIISSAALCFSCGVMGLVKWASAAAGGKVPASRVMGTSGTTVGPGDARVDRKEGGAFTFK